MNIFVVKISVWCYPGPREEWLIPLNFLLTGAGNSKLTRPERTCCMRSCIFSVTSYIEIRTLHSSSRRWKPASWFRKLSCPVIHTDKRTICSNSGTCLQHDLHSKYPIKESVRSHSGVSRFLSPIPNLKRWAWCRFLWRLAQLHEFIWML